MPKSTRDGKPLWLHSATGQRAKKIGGRTYYFGTDAALRRFLDEKDDILAGRQPVRTPEAITIAALVNRFLTAKKVRVASGALSPWQCGGRCRAVRGAGHRVFHG
jgi:hypothetical protein